MRYYSLIVFALLLNACEIINPEEPIPSYLKFDSVTVKTDFETEGTASHNITDLWVLHYNNVVGTFNIPGEIPILKNGSDEIQLYAGIKDNGISTTRQIYPFYKAFVTDIDFEPNATYNFKLEDLTFEYKDVVKIVWHEPFEQETISLQPVQNGLTNYKRTRNSSLVFEGSGALLVEMDQNNTVMGLESFKEFNRSHFETSVPVYLEINYKCDAPISIGYKWRFEDNTIQYENAFMYIHPSEKWKKMYINITDDANRIKENQGIQLYFASVITDSVDYAQVLIDNIKLLTFE